ncbi:MAG: hypothetical protein C4551_07215 [Bacillota bacterium]|nr:MAG: hypothetical protein C4551_07215 [Bacillota bacterium]
MIKADLLERAKKIHEETLIVAVHTDLIGDVAERHSVGESRVLGRLQAGLFRTAGIKCVSDHVIGDSFETQSFPTRDLLTAFQGGKVYNPSMVKHGMKILSYMLRDIDESHEDFAVARTVGEIKSVAGSGRIAVVLCTQGLSPLEDEPALLEIYYRLGIRVLGLATYRGNAAVGGDRWTPEVGLTPLGREIIDEANRLKIVVDLSSVSEKAFWEILERAKGPVIASNTNVRAVCNHPGALSDDQLRGLAEKGGLLGVIANHRTVRADQKRPSLADFVDHISHVAEVVGVDYVGLGPDIVEDTWYPLETYRRVFEHVGYWSCLYPDDFETVAQLPNVTAEMLRRGFSEEDVKKVLGGNILRVYERVWCA